MRIFNLSLPLLLLLSCLAAACSTTQQATAPAENGESDTSGFQEAIEKSQAYEGLFTVYQDTTDGSVKLAIQQDQLGDEFIYFGVTRDGVLDAGHFRGQYRDNKIIRIDRYFDRIEFVHVNNQYYFDEESELSRASGANISDAILHSAKIEAEDEENGVILIDGNGLFLSESLHQIKPSPSPSAGPRQFTLGNLNTSKSKYSDIGSYPENLNMVIHYVYDSPHVTGSTTGSVTDARAVGITYQHTFIKMPDNDYQPRYDDPRVGYFTTQQNDQISTDTTPYKDMIHRWHLVKKDPDAALSEPVEPIVWWIENTTPQRFRETIREAALKWNEAFEAAGFKNAIEVNIQPDDADWDAGDIRYNVLRWTSSPVPPFGGYGPSFVNPRTGQVLGADIMLEWVFFSNHSRSSDVLTDDNTFEDLLSEAMNPAYCSFGHHMHQNNLFGKSALAVMDAPEEELTRFQEEALTMLILHELGHTFALNHNMQASTLHSPEEIHNTDLTEVIGLTGSVMDYSAVNVSRDRDRQGQYFDVKPGPYDIWAIQYGYTSLPDDPEAEQKALEEILSRSVEPQHAFGNDADDMRSAGGGIDPRVMIGDMSDDPVAYAADRIEMVNELMDGLLEKYEKREGQSYQVLRNAFSVLFGQHRTQADVMSRQIGGVYRDRSFIGQEGGDIPFLPVPEETQKQAMEALGTYLFAPDAFHTTHEVYNYLQIQRRGFNLRGSNEDPDIHQMVLSSQRMVLNHLLHPNTLQRITNSRLYGNTYPLSEVMEDLTAAIFEADARGNVNTFRQNIQVDYVNRLAAILESDNHDHISKSAALYNLQQVRNQMRGKSNVNTESAAHAQHVLHLIEKALDAG